MDVLHDGLVARMLCDACDVACLTQSLHNPHLFLAAVSVGSIHLLCASTALTPATQKFVLHVAIIPEVLFVHVHYLILVKLS